MRLLEKTKSPVAASLEQGLPCSQVSVVRKGVGRFIGGEGVWERGGRDGCLRAVGEVATVDEYFLLMRILA